MKANVIVVGGGPSGIITALTTKSVYPEKSVCVIKEIGDSVIPCAIPYMMDTMPDPMQNAKGDQPLETAGFHVIVGKVVFLDTGARSLTLGDDTVLAYERLVLATGTNPVMPPIPGTEKEGVFTVRKSMSAMTALRERVHGAKKWSS
jgi:NADPH-dependent 2,4-dienoyl-CoA reductase/sulfur reductase-like enzyme